MGNKLNNKKESVMKIINNQKSKQAVWAEGDYKIINIEPSDKNGTWLVVRNDMILFASSALADAKRYVERTVISKSLHLVRHGSMLTHQTWFPQKKLLK